MRALELQHDYPQRFRYYDMLVSAFVAVLLISNVLAPKLIEVGPFLFSGAQLLFPVTYIFGDIFTEVYGYAGSRRAIWNGFIASASDDGGERDRGRATSCARLAASAEYETVLGVMPRLVIASLIAYWAGEFANSFVMARMKVLSERPVSLDAHHRFNRCGTSRRYDPGNYDRVCRYLVIFRHRARNHLRAISARLPMRLQRRPSPTRW